VDALLEMKKRGDVMRSDRLKQVMQEIDPSFDEKNVGMNRFSKFVDESKRRGLITATKLENGQFEIDLGPSAPGGDKALPAIPGDADERRERERAERGAEERGGGGRRGRRGGRGRGGRDGERHAEAALPAGALPLAEAFELLKRVLREMGAFAPNTVGEDDVRARMTEIHGKADDPLSHRPRFGRFLRQAHDASIVDVSKNERGFEMTLRAEAQALATAAPAESEPATAEKPARGGRGRGRGRAAAPAAAAEDQPAPPAAAPAVAVVAAPKRGILYRRGRKAPSTAAQIPLVGVVDMEETKAPAEPKAKRAKAAPRRGGARRGAPKKKGAPSDE